MEQLKQDPGTKGDSGKLRYDLIPARPMEELARVYTIGCKKYADRNWEKGISWMRIVGAMMRHLWRWVRGEMFDLETGQHHLSSVAWGAFALIEYEYTHPELDDRPVKDLREKNMKNPNWYGDPLGAAVTGTIVNQLEHRNDKF